MHPDSGILSLLLHLDHGFTQFKFDYSLFTRKQGLSFIALSVYVDDILIASNDDSSIAGLKSFLRS